MANKKPRRVSEEVIAIGKRIGKIADEQTDIVHKEWSKGDHTDIINNLVKNDRELIKFQMQCLSLAATSLQTGDDYGKGRAGVFHETCIASRQLITAIRESERLTGNN